MAISYFGFDVSNTNGNKKYNSAIRVYNAKNEKIAEQFININNPVAYVRKCKKSKHIDQLREQCLAGGMSVEQFNSIFWVES